MRRTWTYREWDVKHSPSIDPEDLLHFVYLDGFLDDWATLYPDDRDEFSLNALEILIMSDPTGAPVISGTGGLRKVRFGGLHGGKRGGVRVCFSYFPDYFLVLMVMAYAKNRKDNLTPAEKAAVKDCLADVRGWLDAQ